MRCRECHYKMVEVRDTDENETWYVCPACGLYWNQAMHRHWLREDWARLAVAVLVAAVVEIATQHHHPHDGWTSFSLSAVIVFVMLCLI